MNRLQLMVENTSFLHRPVPLDVLLGGQLRQGNLTGGRLSGRNGAIGFLAYHPAHIGRGVRVLWTPQTIDRIMMVLDSPFTEEDLTDVCGIVERIRFCWNLRIYCQDLRMNMEQFLKTKRAFLAQNLRQLHSCMRDLLDQPDKPLLLDCAMHEIALGEPEAERFWAGVDTARFRDYLHERQSLDAVYENPAFAFAGEHQEAVHGYYTLTEGVRCILPKEPTVPPIFWHRETGQPKLPVSRWYMKICSPARQEIGMMEYHDCLNRLQPESCSRYDERCLLVEGLSRQQLCHLADDAQ